MGDGMKQKPKGWRNEPQRHSLAARGVSTKIRSRGWEQKMPDTIKSNGFTYYLHEINRYNPSMKKTVRDLHKDEYYTKVYPVKHGSKRYYYIYKRSM